MRFVQDRLRLITARKWGTQAAAVAVFFVAFGQPPLVAEDKPSPADCADGRRTSQFTFSYQFTEGCAMRPRGGTSKGAPVTLAMQPSAAWEKLRQTGISDFERDRRAILAMAGPYRASFDFLEISDYSDANEAARPYQSWATEYVYVIEDRSTFISLQHIMVMQFVVDGEISEPVVQKHWRQDWHYEPPSVLAYDGNQRWSLHRIPAEERTGTWSQTVYHVDDSPRYGGFARWRHEERFSSWESNTTLRPVPRREASVRDDYDALEAVNTHVILPRGWVHEEENFKVTLGDENGSRDQLGYLAKELGLNRYERIVGFDFSNGDTYWENTAPYWARVREIFAAAVTEHPTVHLHKSVDGKPLFLALFIAAEEYTTATDQLARRAALAKTDEIIARYLVE